MLPFYFFAFLLPSICLRPTLLHDFSSRTLRTQRLRLVRTPCQIGPVRISDPLSRCATGDRDPESEGCTVVGGRIETNGTINISLVKRCISGLYLHNFLVDHGVPLDYFADKGLSGRRETVFIRHQERESKTLSSV